MKKRKGKRERAEESSGDGLLYSDKECKHLSEGRSCLHRSHDRAVLVELYFIFLLYWRSGHEADSSFRKVNSIEEHSDLFRLPPADLNPVAFKVVM
jgi:hypothetical protein